MDIQELWIKYDSDFQKDKPAARSGATMAALATATPLDGFVVWAGFKAGGKQYRSGDKFIPENRVQAVKFAASENLVPVEVYESWQRYERGKGKHERVKKLYQDIHNAQAQVSRAASAVQQARAAFDSAKDALKAAENRAASLEAEFVKELS